MTYFGLYTLGDILYTLGDKSYTLGDKGNFIDCSYNEKGRCSVL